MVLWLIETTNETEANMAKKQKIVKSGTVVTIEYPTIRKSTSVDLAKLQGWVPGISGVVFDCAMHGLGQKLGDAKSGATAAEKYEMSQRIKESLESGSWDLTSRAVDVSIIIEAVARVKGVAIEAVRKAVENAGEDGLEKVKAWKANAKVVAAIAKIRAERAEQAAAEASDEDIEIDFDEETGEEQE